MSDRAAALQRVVPPRQLQADAVGIVLLDEVDTVADVDRLEIREALPAPGQRGLVGDSSGTRMEEQPMTLP